MKKTKARKVEETESPRDKPSAEFNPAPVFSQSYTPDELRKLAEANPNLDFVIGNSFGDVHFIGRFAEATMWFESKKTLGAMPPWPVTDLHHLKAMMARRRGDRK